MHDSRYVSWRCTSVLMCIFASGDLTPSCALLAPQSFGEIQEAAYADKEVEVQQLKTAKKLLVKEVKTLRAEMSTVQAERDAAQSQLEQVKAALAIIMRI